MAFACFCHPKEAAGLGCAKLCAELLSDEGSSSAGQRQKLRREALHALKAIYKLCQRGDGLPKDVSDAVAEALLGPEPRFDDCFEAYFHLFSHVLTRGIRDATPSQQRRGEARGHGL